MCRVIPFLVVALLLSCPAFAEFPSITLGDVVPNDQRLGKPIGKSKTNELTIASFNIRNLGSRGRSLKIFEALTDLIDEADVVEIQEAGLGVYRNNQVSPKEKERIKGVISLLEIFLGDDWAVITPPEPTGTGNGRETTILAYRKKGKGFEIKAEWSQYVDLGDKRDMAVFKLNLSNGSDTEEILLGSVHLTPEDPDRGQQMVKAAKWLVDHKDQNALIGGDFNWGYKKTSGIENYKGENAVKKFQEEESLFQVFHSMSYLGKSKEAQLRTNMGFRKSGFFYDQFLITPQLTEKLADGGSFLKDCGILAFGVHNKNMKKVISDLHKQNSFGLKKYLKFAEGSTPVHQEALDKAEKKIEQQAQNNATFLISDHRVIWVQFKFWG